MRGRTPRLRWLVALMLLASGAPAAVAETSATASNPAADAARAIIESGRYQRALPGQASQSRRPPPVVSGRTPAGSRRPTPLPPPTAPTTLDSQRDVVSGLLLIVASLAALLMLPPLARAIARIRRARRHRPTFPSSAPQGPADSAPDMTPAARLREQAFALATAGRTRDAILWLWRGSLATLAGHPLPPPPDPTALRTPFRTAAGADLTGREIVRFFASQGIIAPPRTAALESLLFHMELAVFGLKDVTPADFAACDAAFAVLIAPRAMDTP